MRVDAKVHRGRWVAATAVCSAVALVSTACSGTGAPVERGLELAVTPAEQQGAVRPDAPVTVRATNGTVENVTVRAGDEPVEGELSSDRSEWKSRWALTPGTRYTVSATGLGSNGKTGTVTSSFDTQKVSNTVGLDLEAPFDKETVGVGIPVILQFDRAVTNRDAVERGLELRSSKPVEGAWRWFGDQSIVFRTKKYWPRDTKVELHTHLSGVQVTKDRWGPADRTVRFTVGDEIITRASAKSKQMTVHRNGKKLRTMPVSMGKGGVRKYITTNGDHLTMEKASPVIMDSSTVGCGPGCPGYYRQTVYSAVRISDSGEYVHGAPWSVGSQGNSNVSHGCINLSPSNAKWFYQLSQRGDPYKVTGTSRELEPENGWGYWQIDWKDWVKGSALKQSLHIGAEGATPAPAS